MFSATKYAANGSHAAKPMQISQKQFWPRLRLQMWLSPLLLFSIMLNNGSVVAQTVTIPVTHLDQSARIASAMVGVQNDPDGAASLAAFLAVMEELQRRTGQTPTPPDVVRLHEEYIKQLRSDIKTYGSIRDPWSNPVASDALNALTTAASIALPAFSPEITMAAAGVQFTLKNSLKDDPQFRGMQTDLAALQGSLEQIQTPALNNEIFSRLFQRADDLAQSDPIWRQIHDDLLISFTKVSPGDTVEDVLRKVPELADSAALQALAAQPRVNGQITITKEQLSTLFQQEVGALVSTIETNRALLVQISATQSNILSYLTNQVAVTAAREQKERERAETARVIQAANASIYLLSTAIGFGDPKLGREIYAVGNSTVQMADALNKLDVSDLANTLISSANMVGAVMNVISLFGSGGPTPDQLILEQIGALREQVNQLRLEMHERFDRIDQSLNQIYQTMVLGFDQINGNINEVRGALFNLQMDLHRLERQVYAFLNAGFRRDLNEAINGALDYETKFGHPMDSFDTYRTFENKFYTWAVDNSKDELESTYGQGYDDASLHDQLTSRPLESNLNYISGFLNQRLGLPLLSFSKLANPRDWAISARAYVQLARENPQYFRHVSTNRLRNVIAVGRELESSVAYITFTNGPSRSGPNWSLWSSVFNYYRVQLQDFANQLVASESAYKLQFPELLSVDILHEANYAEVVAGSYAIPSAIYDDFEPKDGIGNNAYLNQVGSAAGYSSRFINVAPDGGILFIDAFPRHIPKVYYLRRVSPNGTVTTLATITSNPIIDGQPWTRPNKEFRVTGFSSTFDGNVFLTYGYGDPGLIGVSMAPAILKIDTNGLLTTFAGQADQIGYLDGPANQALFSEPNLAGLGRNQSIYLLDRFAGTNRLREIDGKKTVSTIAFNTDSTFSWESLLPVQAGVVSDSKGGVYYLSITSPLVCAPWGVTKLSNGIATPLKNFNGVSAYWAITIGANGPLWVFGSGVRGFPCDVGPSLTAYDLQAQQGQTIWRGSNASRPILGGALGEAWLGRSEEYSMSVDPWNNLYLCLNGKYVTDSTPPIVHVGFFVVRIGGRWNHQIGTFQQFASDLQTAGNLQAAAKRLDGAKELLKDLITLGLSQSFDDDDVLRSMLVGSDGLVDSGIALALINNQLTALSNAPVRPLLDVPSVASARLDALERQVKLHLLEIDSLSHAPTDSLVLHLTITNNTPLDDSPARHTIGLLGTPGFQSFGLVGPQSLAGGNDSEGTTITNGFTLGQASDLTFGTNTDFTVTFWAAPNFVTVLAGPALYRPPPEGFLFIGDVATTLGSEPGWWLRLDANGVLTSSFLRTGITNAPSGVLDQWMNCALVFSRSAGVVRFYVNGLKIQQDFTANEFSSLGNGNVIMGGTVVTNYSLDFRGNLRETVQQPLLNEFAVWRRALGTEEIKAIYDAGRAGRGIVAISQGFQRNTSPTEPLRIVHSILHELRLLQSFRTSPVPLPRLTGTFDPTSRALQLTVYGEPGSRYVLESSPNLNAWQTNTPSLKDGTPTTVGTAATPARFFRARRPE